MEPGGSKSHSQGLNPVLRPCVAFLYEDSFSSHQSPKLEDHSWLAVHDCFLNIFAANLHIWRPTPPYVTQLKRHAMMTGIHG